MWDGLSRGHPILGVTEDIESVLDVLEVRGIAVERIVVADRFARLAPAAQKALLQIERSRGLTLQLLTEVLSLEPGKRATSKKPGSPCILPARQSFEIPSQELHALLQGNFWKIKRGLDAAAALGLIVLLAPLFLFVAIGIAGSLGFPVVFRQRRPGLCRKILSALQISHDAGHPRPQWPPSSRRRTHIGLWQFSAPHQTR